MKKVTSNIVYSGDLRTLATHVASGTQLLTDAPVDNNGKGLKFSPTDLTATSLACCMFTLMGIHAEKNRINLGEIKADLYKHMASNPRRIGKIEIRITLSGKSYTNEQKGILEKAALTCPVAKSLHPDIVQDITFDYQT